MSEIITDNLTGKTSAGNVTITSEGGSATMQLQQGLAKAWVNFNGTGTIAERDSLGVSGLVDNGTGNYSVNYTNAMSNAEYSISGISTWNTSGTSGSIFAASTGTFSTTSQQIVVYQSNSLFALLDSHTVCLNVFGDLA
jgi:hypothetical protein